MPRIDFAAENKVQTTNFDFPKLKLKNGQRARLLLLESPIVEYVHELRAPQIIDGKPQMVTQQRRDGTEYQDYKKDFLSKPLCLGDFNVLQEKGADEAACPICKMAKDHPDWVAPPKRRYAMHVISYKIKSGDSFDLTTPFACEVLVWSFTDVVFNRIIDFKNEWGDLRKHDLLLGPCTNETFQKFDMQVGATAAWMADKARGDLVKETFANNQIPDLSIACGSKKEVRWINIDLDTIRERWAKVSTAPAAVTEIDHAAATASLDADLAGLLDTPAAPAAEAPEAPAPAAADLDDLLGESVADEEAPAETAAASEEKTEPDTGAADFEDLLAGL